MPSLKDIRTRIGSVKNTQKITKAMKMVAAAKLRRAQEAVVSTRPYAEKLLDMIDHLAERVDHEKHALLRHPEAPARSAVLVIAGNRGLCGAYNSNVLKLGHRYYGDLDGTREGVELTLVGRKADDFFKRRPDVTITASESEPQAALPLAQRLGDTYAERFAEGEIDELFVVYTRFRSAIAQEVVVDRVLPLRGVPEEGEADEALSLIDYIYEPSADEILDTLLPQSVVIQIQRAILESEASEHGARMTAMDNATNNAGDMISSLTLQYNRARQAAITTELTEIISGAEAV